MLWWTVDTPLTDELSRWPALISPLRAFISAATSAKARARRFRPTQANYLVNVLRLGPGARVLTFNGRDGEYAASIGAVARKSATLAIGERTRPQEYPPDVDYLFAPLKHARLDYVAQKAVEMGARRLRPVITRRTQATRVNIERLRANAREAAEQCGVIWLPEIEPRGTAGKGSRELARRAAAGLLRRGCAAGQSDRRARQRRAERGHHAVDRSRGRIRR